MFTDIVGYTSLTQSDEAFAVRMLEKHRELIRPVILAHGGREVKTIGDGFLVEFVSALEATECAVEMQKVLHEYNLNATEKILIKIGVHVGDVIHREGDVLGDAVNIASRIEPLAQGGEICISEQVYAQVRNKISLRMVRLEPQNLKNVAFRIDVYKLELPWEEEVMRQGEGYNRYRLAVLPLANISPDPKDEYFADGLTEELITTLSQLRGLQVIARTSIMPYKAARKRISEIGRELEVGSVLEGSVRKNGDRIRVTTQLVETSTQAHVWSSTYDREVDDVFAIQSDIASRVAEALKIELLSNDRERLDKVPTTSTEAYILYLKGRNYVGERTRQGFNKAVEYFEKAVKLDPSYAYAYTGLSDCYHLLENWGFMHPTAAWQKSKEYASRALSIDDLLAEAHTSMAMARAIMDWNWKGAEKEFKHALALNPNYVTAHHWYATHFLVAQRRLDDATREMREAYKLDPLSPVIVTNLGRVLFLSGHREEAINHYRLALELNPNFAYAHVQLGVALLFMSSVEEGEKEIETAIRASPDFIEAQAALAVAHAKSGRTSNGEKILEALKRGSNSAYVPSTWIGVVCGALGDLDQAFEWLGRAAKEHSSTFPEYCSEPLFDALENDSRFGQLLKGMGLPGP